MSTVKDQAICIRSVNYSESSQIVTLFGRGHGKIRAIAKGSRRGRGKFGAGIDVLTGGAVIFVPARNESTLATLTEFDVQEPFSGLRRDLLALHCGQYMCELLGQLTEDLDPHEALYDAFAAALEQLQATDRAEVALLGFELILLHEIGLSPVWNRCSSCQRDLPAKGHIYFSSSAGGVLCRDCEPAVIEKRFVEPHVLQILQNPTMAKRAARQNVIEAHELLSYHQRELAGKQTAVMKFVNQLLHNHTGESVNE